MNIAVLGAGHMGAWLSRKFAEDHPVVVYDVDPSAAARVPKSLQIATVAGLAEFHPDLLVNAVSLPRTLEAFEAALPFCPSGCWLADIASVKGTIPEFYRRCGFPFVSVHPMFGPTFTDVENLKNENAVIITESDPAAARFFRDFFAGLGLHIYESSFREHDRMIAYSLALPFVSTMVFAACMTDQAVPGTTFKKHLDIAKGLLSENDDLLTEIIFNPEALIQLEHITSKLEFLKHVIRQRDGEEAARFFKGLRRNLGPGRTAASPENIPKP